MLLEKGSESCKEDVKAGQMQRRITLLEQELEYERRTNRENKQEMEKLEKDV